MFKLLLIVVLSFVSLSVHASEKFYLADANVIIIHGVTATIDTPVGDFHCTINARDVDVDDYNKSFEATTFTCNNESVFIVKMYLDDPTQSAIASASYDGQGNIVRRTDTFAKAKGIWVLTSSKQFK